MVVSTVVEGNLHESQELVIRPFKMSPLGGPTEWGHYSARSMSIQSDFVAIDFETANYSNDSACSIGLVKVRGGEIVEKVVELIKPPSREFVFTGITSVSGMKSAKR